MPFLNSEGYELRVLELHQAPADGHYFQLVRKIGFREHAGPEDSETNPTYWAPAHRLSNNPGPGNRTDLASVPWVFWSFIASYGKQSAPAILHDHQSEVALGLPAAEALRQRTHADRLFRVGLRQQKVPLLSAWLMWVIVSYERYFRHAKWRLALMVVQTLVGAGLCYAAIIVAFGQPLWLLLLLTPAMASVLWGGDAPLLLWGSYSSAVLLPLVLAQLLILLPFWVLVVFVREAIDRPFIDHHPSTVIAPYFRPRR